MAAEADQFLAHLSDESKDKAALVMVAVLQAIDPLKRLGLVSVEEIAAGVAVVLGMLQKGIKETSAK